MKKQKRKVLVIADLEAKLEKYGRRIQKLSTEAYQVRQYLEYLQSQEKINAVPYTEPEGQSGSRTTDANTGGSDVQDPTTSEAVLGEQSTTI